MEIAIPAYYVVFFCIHFERGGDCVGHFFFVKVSPFLFTFFFLCLFFNELVELGRMKRNFESSLICSFVFLFCSFSSKFCLSKKLVSCYTLMFENKTSKDSVRLVKVQYTTKYCLISFIYRVSYS